MQISQVNGAQNRFWICNLLDLEPVDLEPNGKGTEISFYPWGKRGEWVRELVRTEETPPDGVVFVESASTRSGSGNLEDFDFRWDFYNVDGSQAEMCGNAARCVVWWYLVHRKQEGLGSVHLRSFTQKRVRFQTLRGPVDGEISDPSQPSLVSVWWWSPGDSDGGARGDFGVSQDLPPESMKLRTMSVHINPEELGNRRDGGGLTSSVQGVFVNTGVPHFVLFSSPQRDLALALRRVSDFGPEGANITFVEVEEAKTPTTTPIASPLRVRALTFERGVENFTQACGTGAVAAAWAVQDKIQGKNRMPTEIEIEMPGGRLYVQLYPYTNPGAPRLISLKGPVEWERDFLKEVTLES